MYSHRLCCCKFNFLILKFLYDPVSFIFHLHLLVILITMSDLFCFQIYFYNQFFIIYDECLKDVAIKLICLQMHINIYKGVKPCSSLFN